MSTKIIYALLILSAFIMSSCEVYKTLYGGIPGNISNVSQPKKEIKPGLIEVPIESKGPKESNVIIVEETELISLQPKAEDPDNDNLVFTYTSPLSENGQWQTTYGDEGEYTITVTVSDGQLATSKDILVIVKKREEPPVIDATKPIETAVFVDEASKAEFSVTASDLNDDILTYEWKLDGDVAGSDRSFNYKPDYDASGSHTLKVDVSDGSSVVNHLWSVTVNNINRAPKLTKIPDITAKENEEIAIIIDAFDEDDDELTYSIDNERFIEESKETFAWKTDYESAGKYIVKVAVSDGQDEVAQDINVEIQNVNRPPVIIDIVQK